MTHYNLHCNRPCDATPHSPSTTHCCCPLFPDQQPRSLCAAESYVLLKLLRVNNISTELQEKASNLARLVNTVIHHGEHTKDPPTLSSTAPPPILLIPLFSCAAVSCSVLFLSYRQHLFTCILFFPFLSLQRQLFLHLHSLILSLYS